MPEPSGPTALCRRTCLAGMGGFTSLALHNGIALAAQSEAPALTEIPLALNLFTRLAARVQLEPRRTSLFVLDTGAQATSLSDRLVEEMGLSRGPDVLVHSVTTSSLVSSARLPRLKLQGESFDNVIASVFPFAQLGAEGLLGLNHLQAFSLLLDIRRQQATLNPSQSRGVSFNFGDSTNATRIERLMSSVPSQRSDGLLLMNVTVGPVEAVAFLDTGSQYSVANLNLLAALGYRPDQTQMRTLFGVSGPPIPVHVGPAPSLTLGIKRIPQTPLLFADLHIFGVLGLLSRPALMIGADILGRFDRVGIDYRTNRVTLGDVIRQRLPRP